MSAVACEVETLGDRLNTWAENVLEGDLEREAIQHVEREEPLGTDIKRRQGA